jgi:membrane associated rhomboid family serine protease
MLHPNQIMPIYSISGNLFNSVWRDEASFPICEQNISHTRPPLGRKHSSTQRASKAISAWHPYDSLLLNNANKGRLLPPMDFPEKASSLQKKSRFHYNLVSLLAVAMALAFALIAWFLGDSYFTKAATAFLLVFIYLKVQDHLVLKDLQRMQEYNRFICYCQLRIPGFAIFGGLVFVITGLLQLYLQTRNNIDIYGFIDRYGLVFEDAPNQMWRYLAGPIWHANFAHWASNFIFTITLGMIAGAIGCNSRLSIIFMIGAVFPGLILQYTPNTISSDAYLGLSGGTFCLAGWLTGISMMNKRNLPEYIWIMFLAFACLSGLISTLVDPRSSWFAHGTGFLLGLSAGFLAKAARPSPGV